jgi:glucose-6-phosphate isomerase
MKFLYKNTSLLLSDVIENTSKSLVPYIEHLQSVVDSKNYEAAESSITLPSDEDLLEKVKQLKNEKVTSKLKYVVDIGIGGSNLGTKAIYDAFFGYYDILENSREFNAKMIFVDTNEEEFLAKLVKFIEKLTDKEEILINAISKSGGTTETIANLEIVMAAMKKKFGPSNDRLVITTDEGSALWNEAEKQGISKLGLPKQIGGRYSVLSAVGLFPLAAIGINIGALREGALAARTKALNKDTETNEAVISATILYLHYRNGKNINDNFFFAPQLESIGKWYRQLMGESCGKDGKGITPTVSLGSTDLHSVGQLYLGGPKDKTFTFVSTEKPKYEATVPEKLQFPLVEHLEGKRASTIMAAIKEGIKYAYDKQEQPFMEIILDEVNEYNLGEYLQFKMTEIMYLGKLMGVNTFDQPHVELYKVETKRVLKES